MIGEKLQKFSTVDMLVDQLRNAISTGALAGGQRLIEAELTTRHQVSRGPVREAMRRLAAEGLIEMHHNRGARVRKLSRHEVYTLYEVREMLEGLSARLAAANRSATAERAELATMAVDMDTAASAGAINDYVKLNDRFHSLLVSMSANPHLPQMLGHLHTQAMRYQFRHLLDSVSARESNREHQRVIKAILDEDPEYAERAMRIHIQRSRDMTTTLPDDLFASN